MFGSGWNGAESLRSHDKKTLVSAQNLENKGPEIFLPPRSMVLKVVRGKILETLELGCFPAAHRCALALPRSRCTGHAQRVSGPGAASAVRLSKIGDYLADKFCVLMLSELMGGVQE